MLSSCGSLFFLSMFTATGRESKQVVMVFVVLVKCLQVVSIVRILPVCRCRAWVFSRNRKIDLRFVGFVVDSTTESLIVVKDDWRTAG